jgi:CBS domain-containing protein
MRVQDLMTSDVIYAHPTTSISEVADIIFRNKFHAVPIVENNKVAGIITEDDFFLKGYNDTYLPSFIRTIGQNKIADKAPGNIQEKMKKLLEAKASDLMSKDVLCVPQDLFIEELMEIINKTRFTTFPVVDKENNIQGIITLIDIIGTMKEESRKMRQALSKSKDLREIDKLAQDVNPYWRDTFVLMNKKQVQIWKAIVIMSITAVAISIILSVIIAIYF